MDPGAHRPAHRARATAAPLLLPAFDGNVLGEQDRSAVLQVEPFGALPAPVQTAVPRLSARLRG